MMTTTKPKATSHRLEPVTTTVSAKGWVVIPKDIREHHGLKKGSRVTFVDYAGQISLHPVPEDPVAAGRGLLSGGSPVMREFLADKRREREKEEADIARWRKSDRQAKK